METFVILLCNVFHEDLKDKNDGDVMVMSDLQKPKLNLTFFDEK